MNLPTVFKEIGVLYFVMTQTFIPLNFSPINVSDMYSGKDKLERQIIETNHQALADELPADTRSEKDTNHTPANVIVHSEAVVPQGGHVEKFILPKIVSSPEPTVRQITITPPLHPILTPFPTIKIADITIMPLPSIPPGCGCDSGSWKGMEINCPMYVKEVICVDLDYQ